MTLFNTFFNEFKDTIYKNRGRKFEKDEKILFVIFCIIVAIYLLLTIIYTFFKSLSSNKYYIAAMIFVIIIGSIIYCIFSRKVKKNNPKYYNQHKENVTDALVQLLKSPEYNLYSNKKVSWLIDCCNKKRIIIVI